MTLCVMPNEKILVILGFVVIAPLNIGTFPRVILMTKHWNQQTHSPRNVQQVLGNIEPYEYDTPKFIVAANIKLERHMTHGNTRNIRP